MCVLFILLTCWWLLGLLLLLDCGVVLDDVCVCGGVGCSMGLIVVFVYI